MQLIELAVQVFGKILHCTITSECDLIKKQFMSLGFIFKFVWWVLNVLLCVESSSFYVA